MKQRNKLALIKKGRKMKIKKIMKNSKKMDVYDIETKSHNYILSNGIISHNSMSMYGGNSISGGSGGIYTASTVVEISSRAKEKDGTEITGSIFTANVRKGRMSKENSKLKFLVTYEDGINPWYGLLEDALEAGVVEKPNVGFYSRPCVEDDKKFREKQIYTSDFWMPIFKNTDFKEYLETKYSYINSLDEDSSSYDVETIEFED